MHLVIFDIDGTLIHSHAEEADCFIQALHHVTGISQITKNLQTYQHVTDHGIAHECIVKHLNRFPTTDELAAIEDLFLSHFMQSLTLSPTIPISGAYDLLSNFCQQPDFCLAIATGSYFRSALLKLQHASLDFALPLASCNDSLSRVEIMKFALTKAEAAYQSTFDSVTYFGDGPWDITAVKDLQWKFIGVASNYSPQILKCWGAEMVVDNYLTKGSLLMDYIRKKTEYFPIVSKY